MLKELLFRNTPIPLLSRGLDALSLRQGTIAQNIANAQSEGYRRKEVSFEDELRGVLNRMHGEVFRTHPNHLPLRLDASRIRARIKTANDPIDGPGSEQVVIEREMSDLAQTQLKYEAEVRIVRHHLEMLKMAIRGTR